MVSWDEAVAAMKDEGYVFCLHRETITSDAMQMSYAYSKSRGCGDNSVTSADPDPVCAINSLLFQCRARWPKKHPFDDASLEELLSICRNRCWGPVIIHPGLPNEGTWGAQIGPNGPWPVEFRPADALRAAMKQREVMDE